MALARTAVGVYGTNLKYGHQAVKVRTFANAMAKLFSTAGSTYVPLGLSAKTALGPKICSKTSGTTPGDRAGDLPNCIGDVCLYYIANGTYTAAYVCTALTLTAGVPTACTWTILAVT